MTKRQSKILAEEEPSVYITREMLKLLEEGLHFKQGYEKVEAKGLRKILEKLGIIKARYKITVPEMSSKNLMIKRLEGRKLFNPTREAHH